MTLNRGDKKAMKDLAEQLKKINKEKADWEKAQKEDKKKK